MNRFVMIALGAIALSHAPGVSAQQLVMRADSVLAAAAVLGFSGQVLIAEGDRIVLHKAYGDADRAASRRMTLGTRMGAGSLAKVFTAAAILQLVDRGQLQLDDSIGKYITVPDDKKVITIRQLLNHTSGLPGGGLDAGSDAFDRALAAPMTRKPGERWQYSGLGYVLLGRVITAIARQPYHDYLRNMFRAAGMTTAIAMSDPAIATDGGAARAYVGLHDNGAFTQWLTAPELLGSDGIALTAADVFAWSRAWRTGTVVSDSLRRKAETASAPIQPGVGYGFGHFVWEKEGRTWAIEHGGDDLRGYNAAYFRYPERNATLIIVSNARDSEGRSMRQAVQRVLEAAILGDTATMPRKLKALTAQERRAITGTRRIGDAALHFISAGSLLYAAAEGQSALDALMPADTATTRAATDKTRHIIAELHAARPAAAFSIAVNSDTSSSVAALTSWWTGFVKQNGALRSADALGSIVSGDVVHSYVRFNFVDRGVLTRPAVVRLVFTRDAALVLRSVNPDRVADYPLVLPVGRDENGRLIAADPFSRRSYDVTNAARLPASLHDWRPVR